MLKPGNNKQFKFCEEERFVRCYWQIFGDVILSGILVKTPNQDKTTRLKSMSWLPNRDLGPFFLFGSNKTFMDYKSSLHCKPDQPLKGKPLKVKDKY